MTLAKAQSALEKIRQQQAVEKQAKDEAEQDHMMDEMISIMLMVTLILFLPQVVDILKDNQRRVNFQGRTVTRQLNVTSALQTEDFVANPPNTPLISCFIVNYGPDAVGLQMNGTSEPWIIMQPDETRKIDQTNADVRINSLTFKCQVGEIALVELEGEY